MSELPRRLRAARGYADLTQPELARLLGMGESTYKRVELGTSTLQGFTLDGFLRAVAGHTGLPLEFFTVDLQRLPELAEEPTGITLDDVQLKVFEQLLPEAVALARELRREQEASGDRTGGRGHLRRVEGGDDA